MPFINGLEKEQVSAEAKEVYEEFIEKTGSVPEWVKVMAYRPEILKNFVSLFRAIMMQGTVENLLKWKIAYLVSETLKCPFCVDVTTKMMKKLGASEETIREVLELSEAEDKTVFSLVKDVTLDGHLDNPELFEELQKHFTNPQVIEIISVMGLFNYINRFNNTLAIIPD